MGGLCSAEQKEHFEQRVEDAAEQAQEIKEAIQDKVEGALEQVKDVAEEIKEQVEDAAEQARDAAQAGANNAAEAVAEVQAKVSEQVEEIQDLVEEKVASVKEQAGEALADVKEGAADGAEAVADVMTAALASVTDAMIVEFDDGKGSTRSVHFKTQVLGFSFALARGGCGCMSAPARRVVVRAVDKGQQAAKLGVQRGWAIKSVNGTDITGLEEATKLLAEGESKLPRA